MLFKTLYNFFKSVFLQNFDQNVFKFKFYQKKKKRKTLGLDIKRAAEITFERAFLSVRLALEFYLTYFTIQLIFGTIYGPHCTFWYYLWAPLDYFN